MTAFKRIASVPRWRLANVHMPACLTDTPPTVDAQGFTLVDLVVADGRIESLGAPGPGDAAIPMLDAGGAIVTPCFVDAHTHLDKGHIWPRAENPDGSFERAREAVLADRTAHWTAADVRARMSFALQCAYAHGTGTIRTHIDSPRDQIPISWPVLAELRAEWRGRIDLQATPLFGVDGALDAAHIAEISAAIDAFGSGVLGAVTFMIPQVQAGLDALFALASDKGWDLDFHVDETHDPAAHSLRLIAETAIAHRFEGKVLCGHCCSLARMPDDETRRTIDLVAQAGLAVVSLPMCNMFLQARAPATTPQWRGITLLHELKSAGVPVMIASDNTRDPFYAYGDLDMAEVWREGTRIAHLDRPFGDWANAVFANPADVLRRPAAGRLRIGGPADFVLFSARSWTELFARPQMDRVVVRDGRAIASAPPSYAALDPLYRAG